MLKLTYTETSFYMERLAQSLEDWIATRLILSVRTGENFCVEPMTASFLLPANLPEVPHLQTMVQREGLGAVALSICDAEYLEVSLNGSWVSSDPDSEEGVFVTVMGDRTEFFVFKLWQEVQPCPSAVRD